MIMDVTMGTKVILLIGFLTVATLNNSFCTAKPKVVCIDSERDALLKFKQDLSDPSNRLSSWVGDGEGDCCEWVGVVCSNSTGYVRELHLQNPHANYENDAEYMMYKRSNLGGKINPCLSSLKHLRYLDLSLNNFQGMIPSELGNLTHLQYLDLRPVSHDDGRLYVESLQWLSGLSSLRYLNLSNVNLSQASDHWLQVTNMLPSLVELRLTRCQLAHFPLLPIVNFTSLAVVDLSHNHFHSPIPSVLQNMTRLRHLDMSFNSFNSTIPDWLYSFRHLQHLNLGSNNLPGSITSAIGNWTSAITLDLSYNELLKGKLPKSFENLCSLRVIVLSGLMFSGDASKVLDHILSRCILDGLEVLSLGKTQLSGHFPDVINQLGECNNLAFLDLAQNSLSGPIPTSLGQLTELFILDISKNSLEGVVSEVHFANLTRLRDFGASGNQLTLRVSRNWVPSFQLHSLELSSWELGTKFPHWLYSQKQLRLLDISCTGISDTIPSWFWNLFSQSFYLNISHNHIYGEVLYIPSISTRGLPLIVDLSSNHFKGPIPRLSSNVTELYLSKNSFVGSISFLCDGMHEPKKLRILNLEGNLLSGETPNCWKNWESLEYVNLGSNQLTGSIPSSLGFLTQLRSLHLRNNHLSGTLPASLQNCAKLMLIDLGENEFSGSIPAWIGERLSNLKFLILPSNKFHGHMPVGICALTSLQMIDLSHNNFSGTIPRCLNNITAMSEKQNSDNFIIYNAVPFVYYMLESLKLVMKGNVLEYSTMLSLVRSIDLSDNNLSGEIPEEVTTLIELKTLNLSKNLLMGKIPWKIGSMGFLESIDFSVNKLCGEIPQSMSSLTFLSHLNLSYNNLTGKIPSSTQLQSLDKSSFIGNKLYGPPLTETSSVNGVIPNVPVGGGTSKQSDGSEVDWFIVSIAVGFVVGFWGVIAPLLFNRIWRFLYFQFLDNMWRKFCGVINKCCHIH